MKKTLLSMLTLATASMALAFGNSSLKLIKSDRFENGPLAPAVEKSACTRASGAVDFGYSEEPYTAYSLSNVVGAGSRFCVLFEMAPEDIKAYAGNQVTGFSVYSSTNQSGTSNTITEGRFFYTTDLSSEEYTQDFTMSKTAFALNEVAMESPYTITGEEKNLYFGYSFIIPKANNMYYVVVDGTPNNYPGSLIIGYAADGSFPTQFESVASEIGALCMTIKIEGDAIPENMASIKEVGYPRYLPISGEGADIDFVVKNNSINDMTSVTVKASVTGMPDAVKTFDFSAVPFGGTVMLTFDGLKANEEAFVDFAMQIVKVNGEEYDGAAVVANVPAYDEGFVKKIVAEDATGTWCGWCPGGIEALEYLKTTYPDRAIAIGAHYGDEMEIASYLDYINAYVDGFPNVMYNRMISQTPTQTYDKVCQYIDLVAEYFDYPVYAEVTLDGKTSEDGKTASVTAYANFKLATSEPHYLSFVVVEDGVGPYSQENYYKKQKVAMNGWEKKNSQVPTVFNDVARYYNCFPGIENSLPASIEANSINEYSIDLPLANVSGNEYRVIALLTNAQTGDIINACQYSMTKDNSSNAVESVLDASAPAEYFNLNGVKVAQPCNGIFIRRQGDKVEKIIIK